MKPIPPRPAFFAFVLRQPPPWLGWAVPIIAMVVVAYLNLGPLRDVPLSLAYVVPLFLCLWSRNPRLLYLLAMTASVLTYYKHVVVLPQASQAGVTNHVGAWVLQLLNIWLPTLAIHLADYSFDRLDLKRKLLLESNGELTQSNRDLAQREEEVTQQNEELHTQAEELERQAVELRQQAEELEQQTMELHAANDELTRRERGLQTLLESARWLRSDLSEADVMSAVCQAAVQVMEEGVSAAAVVHCMDNKLMLRGHFGFGVHGAMRQEVPWSHTFAQLVMERNQTAYIADLATRPDVIIPQPAAGRPFRSILATPLSLEGRVIGVVEVYAQQPREWTDGEFKVVEWLSAQCALALQAIEYQQEVVIKRKEAEEASIQKTRFLAAISHDVRTPANAISLMADLIEQSAANASSPGAIAELPTLARDLKANARSLVDLVSDVLDLTRLDTGKLDLQVFEFPLLPLLENEVRTFQRIAAEKQLRLTLHPMPSSVQPGGGAPGSIHLRTDRMKLARVISNLLGNAVKFTEAGAIDIRTERRPDGGLTIEVTDTGVGIPQESLPRIFDEFYQLQNPERDRNKGSGLGLAICKRLVDALGCTLEARSTLGVGTTFAIVLPRELVVIAPAAAVRGDGSGPGEAQPGMWNRDGGVRGGQTLRDIKVLLVEDHDVTRRAAARLLSATGANVLEARTGREALHLLVHDEPDVVLLDLMLPDADGTDILKHLKNRRPPSLRCVLAVSGDVRDSRIAEVKDLGADDLLAKPLDIQKLIAAIARRLKAHNGATK